MGFMIEGYVSVHGLCDTILKLQYVCSSLKSCCHADDGIFFPSRKSAAGPKVDSMLAAFTGDQPCQPQASLDSILLALVFYSFFSIQSRWCSR